MPKSLSTAALIFGKKQLNNHAASLSFIANNILKGLTKFNVLCHILRAGLVGRPFSPQAGESGLVSCLRMLICGWEDNIKMLLQLIG
jgi:hypothetical protein